MMQRNSESVLLLCMLDRILASGQLLRRHFLIGFDVVHMRVCVETVNCILRERNTKHQDQELAILRWKKTEYRDNSRKAFDQRVLMSNSTTLLLSVVLDTKSHPCISIVYFK